MGNSQCSAKSVAPETTDRKDQEEVTDVSPVVRRVIMTPNLHIRENKLTAMDVTPTALIEAAPKATDPFLTPNEMVQTCNRKSTSTKNANNSPWINSRSEARSETRVRNDLKACVMKGVSDIRTSTPLTDITTEIRAAYDPVTPGANSTVWATTAESPLTTGDALSTSADGR